MMNDIPVRSTAKAAIPVLSLLFLLIGCTPTLTVAPAQNLTEGQVKTLVADVFQTPCMGSVTAYLRNPQEPTTWSPTSSAVVSGQTNTAVTYSSDVPGSDRFPAGRSYDYKWVVTYRTYFPPIINWFIGPCGTAGSIEQSSSFTVTPRPAATLTLSPDPLNIVQGGSGTLTVGVTRGGGFTGAVSVTFAGNPGAVTFNPSTLTIAASSATSTVSALSTAASGTYTVTATARDASGTVMDQKTFTLAIAPRPSFTLTLSPDPLNIVQGGSGLLTVGVTRGGGFTGAVTVTFAGSPGAVSFNPSTLTIAASSATSTVSALSTAASGTYPVTASGRDGSGTITAQKVFTLRVNPSPPALVFRSSNIDVQSFNFANPASPILVDTKPATTSTGGMTSVVGLSYNNGGYLVRTGTLDVQAYSVSAAGLLTLTSTLSTSTSITGVAVWANGSTVIRASEMGIQAFALVSGSLQARGSLSAYTTLTGVAVDAYGTRAVRAHNAGIEVFEIGNLSALSLARNDTSGSTSTTGVDVKMYASGSRAVRAHNMGIEVYDLSSVTRLGSGTGFTSTTGVAVSVDASGTRAVRAYNLGIEVYDISTPASITRMGYKTGSTSTTGVDVYVRGNYAYRATNMLVEVYDISNPASIQLLGSITATTSATGIGIAVQ